MGAIGRLSLRHRLRREIFCGAAEEEIDVDEMVEAVDDWCFNRWLLRGCCDWPPFGCFKSMMLANFVVIFTPSRSAKLVIIIWFRIFVWSGYNRYTFCITLNTNFHFSSDRILLTLLITNCSLSILV